MHALRGRFVVPLLVLLAALVAAGSASAGAGTMTASDDSLKAYPNGVVDVLANDSATTLPITVVGNSQPANGQVTCSTLGACFYKSNAGSTATSDSFTYTARSGDGAEGTATVTVIIGSSTARAALIARDDDVAVPFDAVDRGFNVLANDTGDQIQLVDNGNPQHGAVNCTADGNCKYTPARGYTGSDGFVYSIEECAAAAPQARRHSNPGCSGRHASAAVHILVAPAGTSYGMSVGGAPLNPVNGSIPSGGKAGWALNVFSVPDGVSGQELAAFPAPEGKGSLAGPHSLDAGSVKTAKGWSSTVNGSSLTYKAGKDALLGSSYTQTFPRPLPPISQGTGGDGHVPILLGSKVFAFYHHSHPTSATCVDRATGDVCPGYPKRLDQGNFGPGGFETTDNNGPGVVNGSKIWTHLYVSASRTASIGLFCWDESTDSPCGYTIVDRVAGGFANASAPVQGSDGNMWFAADTGKAYCVNPSNGETCGSVDTPLPQTSSSFDAVTQGSRVYFSRENSDQDGNSVTCVDVVARALCAGWGQAQKFTGNQWNLVNQHGANGDINGICVFYGQSGTCMPSEDPSAGARHAVTNFVHFEPHYSGSLEAEFGTRTLVGSLDRTGVGCYDWSKPDGDNPGSPCTGGDYGNNGAPPGWVNHETSGASLPDRGAYGVASDGSCAIALGDRGRVYTVDPAGSAPCVSLGSGTDRTTIDLRDQRCDGTVGTAAWRNVVLSDTNADEMESIVITIRDARTGEVLKSGEVIGNNTLDLADINAAQHPAITIDATAKSKSGNAAWDDGIPPRIRLNWKSDPQTTCLVSTGSNACGSAPADVSVAGNLENVAGKPGGEAHLKLLRNPCGGVKGKQAKSCGGKRLFRIHLRFKGKNARKITVTVKGKKQKQLKMKPRPVFRVDLRKYARQRIVVKIRIVTKKGKVLKGTRVYHPCTKKRPGKGFRF